MDSRPSKQLAATNRNNSLICKYIYGFYILFLFSRIHTHTLPLLYTQFQRVPILFTGYTTDLQDAVYWWQSWGSFGCSSDIMHQWRFIFLFALVQSCSTSFLYVHSCRGPLTTLVSLFDGLLSTLLFYRPRISGLPGKPWYLIMWIQEVFFNTYFASILGMIEFCKSLSVKECFLISCWNPPFVRFHFKLVSGYFIPGRHPQALCLSLSCKHMYHICSIAAE